MTATLPLRTVFLLAILLGVSIPAGLMGALTLNLQRQAISTGLHQDQKRMLDILALGLQEPLWNLSRSAGRPLIESVMDDPRVVAIRVVDTQTGSVFLSEIRNDRRIGSVEVGVKPIIYRGEEIGQVSIEFDTANLALALSSGLQRLLLTVFAQIVLAMILIMAILHTRFLRPLGVLTRQATQLAELTLDGTFEWDRQDEIGRLGRHLAWTRSELKRLFDELRAKTDALEADLAHRREIEDALRRSETKYRELFWSNLDGIVICDLDGQIQDANPAFLHLTGHTLEQLKSLNFWGMVAQESHAIEHFNLDNKVLHLGYCEEFEANYLNRFGHPVPVSVKTVAMRAPAGQIVAVWRMVRDISERRSAEERMQLAAKVFDNTTEGILITDADQRIRVVNRAFCDITGYGQAEVLGQRPALLASGRHDREFFQQMWQQLQQQGAWQGEIWNRRKNGEIYPEWLAINVVRNTMDDISHYVAIFSDQTERLAADERIQFLAHFDVLTSLPNRAFMQDRTQLAIQAAARDGAYLALLLLDLDRFKMINESLGHSAGDLLLQMAADRIKAVLEPGQMLARQGGDEFIIVLPGLADTAEADKVAERIIATFAAPVELRGHQITVTTSMGISVYPADGQDFDMLVRNADTAMYYAKSQGRNGFKRYTANLNALAHEVLAIETQLRTGLERNEFVLHYQPQVDMQTGRIVGAEALIRWQHPTLGLIGPYRFIHVAENCGFITQLGNWVIQECCRQQASWRQQGLPAITLALNLSALQFAQPDLLDTLQQALAVHNLPGDALDIEVTESVVMEDADSTIQLINRIKAMGMHLSIDDFGTGYSSLSYLKRFKADKLKIDRSFVESIPEDSDSCEIAKAVINIARILNMRVLAEGVETVAQWQFLLAEGCDLVQGYLLAKPVPVDDFVVLLREALLLPPVQGG